MEDSIVYCKTQNSYEITKLIDMLKEVLDEAKIDFVRDPNQGMEKVAKDKKNEDNDDDKNEDSDTENESDNSDNEQNKKNTKTKKTKNKKVKESSSESEDTESEDEKPKKGKNAKNAKKITKKSNKKKNDSDEDDDDERPPTPKKSNKKKSVEKDDDKDDNDSETSVSNKSKTIEKKKNTGGIRIVALDPHRTLLIYVKLSADEFDEFYVKSKNMYSIGLDLAQLHKFMKTVDKDSIMTMRIDKDDEQYIKFELENNVKNNITAYSQKVLDIDDDPTKLPQDTCFEMSVAMDTSDFRKICQEMNQFAEYVEITCTAKEITFRCQGDSTAFNKVFKNSDTGVRIMCPNKDNKKDKLVMVQAIYNLKHLVTFGKCVNLCTEMQLFLKNDYPLFINYPIGNIGKMLVGLSPVDEKTIKRDADYDDSNDKYYSTNKKAVMKEMK